ncbi:alkaline phosphatase [Haloferula luteola]|uniref:Alkaline phosphatase n=1 Tax=Haloferula luteola TaxID=595692 RepID=A0A840UZ79_9BACT|nr:alkaline phosphatase [Haloferula luteola]MBB5350303.1 alkaline phosphatase [Haloferula luteola]
MKISRRHLLGTGLLGSVASLLPTSLPAAPPVGAKSGKVRGVIFMVSDGMSHGVLSITEAFSRQVRDCPTRWWNLMSEKSSFQGLMDTASGNSLVTDSAAASSAWSSGHRIPNGQINVDANGRQLQSIGEAVVAGGARLGLVTTATVTHATPAGFAAQTPDRDAEDRIAPQYLNRAEIVLGGGSKFFDPAQRADQKDIYADYQAAGYDILRTRDQLLAAKSGKLLGTFFPGHLPYMVDREQDAQLQANVPTLAEMSRAALERFLPSDQSFLLQIEGARIDHAAHANDIGAIVREQMAFDDAMATVLEMIADHPDVLVIATSDHGNSNPALNGTGAKYGQTNEHFKRIADIHCSHEKLLADWTAKNGNRSDLQEMIEQGFGFRPDDQEAEALLATLAGKAFIQWSHQLSNPPGLLGQITGNHTGTGWTSVSHTSDPTAITATGPGADQFAGLVRNDHVRGKILGLLQIA